MTTDWDDEFVYRPKLYKALYGIYYATEGFATSGILMFLIDYLRINLLITGLYAGIILAITAIPGYIKVVYGLISDSNPIGRFGYRRGYVLVSIPLILGGWLLFPFAVEAWSFTLLVFISTLGFYIGDAAVDAWAVDVTPENDRGSIMGIGFGATGVASVLGVLITALATPIYGYATSFVILGTIGGIGGLVWFTFAKEKPVLEKREIRDSINALAGELKSSYIWVAFIGFTGAGLILGIGTSFMSVWAQDVLLFDMLTAGLLVLTWSLFYFIGAVIGGVTYDKFKNYKTGVYVLAPAFPFFLFLLGFNQAGAMELAFATIIMFGLASGLATAAIMGLAMHITPPRIAGTVFAIFTSLVNVGQAGIGNVFMGYMTEYFNYPLAFTIGALIAIPIIATARFINPPWKEESEPPEEPPPPPTEARWLGDT
jgi:ACS family glucarate transporter-like MFS transporter